MVSPTIGGSYHQKDFLFILIAILFTSCSNINGVQENINEEKTNQELEQTEVSRNELEEDNQDIPVEETDYVSFLIKKASVIDFSIKLFPLEITSEVDTMYREAYLGILKNEMQGIYPSSADEPYFFREL